MGLLALIILDVWTWGDFRLRRRRALKGSLRGQYCGKNWNKIITVNLDK